MDYLSSLEMYKFVLMIETKSLFQAKELEALIKRIKSLTKVHDFLDYCSDKMLIILSKPPKCSGKWIKLLMIKQVLRNLVKN